MCLAVVLVVLVWCFCCDLFEFPLGSFWGWGWSWRNVGAISPGIVLGQGLELVSEQALEDLADLLSDAPTLPWNQAQAAQRSDVAVELPTKHCAFNGCQFQSL